MAERSVRADPAGLSAKAQAFAAQIAEAERELSALADQMEQLKRWKGEAGTVALQGCTKLSGEAADVIRSFRTLPRKLQIIAGAYQETEEEITLQAGALPAGNADPGNAGSGNHG